MIDNYDVIVVALGSMGSAAAHTLAARGLRVLGLETFGPAHDNQGLAHGGTRIVRQAYFQDPAYVPRGALDGWWERQEQSGRDLIRLCGGIYISNPDNMIFKGSLEAARARPVPRSAPRRRDSSPVSHDASGGPRRRTVRDERRLRTAGGDGAGQRGTRPSAGRSTALRRAGDQLDDHAWGWSRRGHLERTLRG
jgi:glycine/D-amino acid oxidase-like deaminating enzyme